jgi:hypothetical protein
MSSGKNEDKQELRGAAWVATGKKDRDEASRNRKEKRGQKAIERIRVTGVLIPDDLLLK